MRSSTIHRAGALALAALVLGGGLPSGAAQAQPRDAAEGSDGSVIVGYDCTGRPITRFDTPPFWCPPGAPVATQGLAAGDHERSEPVITCLAAIPPCGVAGRPTQ